jgi:ribosomal protein S18 acetylase RimI-like enzyme
VLERARIERDVHVHVWDRADPEVDRCVQFRDRLRASPEDRNRYEKLKRLLAQRDWGDMNDYAEAKSSLVQEILARAGTPRTSSRGLIRPVRMTDATAIAALLGELGYPAEADDVVARLERVLGRDSGILVYDLEREAVGLVTYQLIHLLYRSLPQCRITALVVREDRRRRGIARALLRAVESLARERGCFRLEVTTRPDRDDALGLYIASGFCERPRRLVKRLDDG